MADKIRANYPAMEEMAKQMELLANRLSELGDSALKINSQMEAGALQGDPGLAFGLALSLLNLRIRTLAYRTEQAGQGIRAAMSDMQQADGSAASDFN